ncbi:cytochrome c oxidase biogenesis protein Cmc1-like protein [Peziza echinospora]|nr:cytochrome c oxidase biogenesis protein Cmc1-like protein [Peziza echinospora]
MHPHLHTKENAGCDEIIAALDACHARGFLVKATGMCNGVKRDVTKCLRAERVERMRKHREPALVKRAEIKQMFKDIDANS